MPAYYKYTAAVYSKYYRYIPAYYAYTAPEKYTYYYYYLNSEDDSVTTRKELSSYTIDGYHRNDFYVSSSWPFTIRATSSYLIAPESGYYSIRQFVNYFSYYMTGYIGLWQLQNMYSGASWTGGADIAVSADTFIGFKNGYYYRTSGSTWNGTIIEDSGYFHVGLMIGYIIWDSYDYTYYYYSNTFGYRYHAAYYAYTAAKYYYSTSLVTKAYYAYTAPKYYNALKYKYYTV